MPLCKGILCRIPGIFLLAAALAAVLPCAVAKPEKQKIPKAFDPSKPGIGDLAIEEARKHDTNHNGRIDFLEVNALRAAYVADPKSWLYIFDVNGDRILSDAEVAKIVIPPPVSKTKETPVPKK